MPGKFGVALKTRKPLAAAFKLDRDDVAVTPVMSAPGFSVDIDANDIHAVDFHLTLSIPVIGRPFPRTDQHQNGSDGPARDHKNKSDVKRAGPLA